jgi:hypothetical protein
MAAACPPQNLYSFQAIFGGDGLHRAGDDVRLLQPVEEVAVGIGNH